MQWHISQVRRTVVTRVHEAVKALALCHNVTPVRKKEGASNDESMEDDVAHMEMESQIEETSEDITYQASSPDEVCIS